MSYGKPIACPKECTGPKVKGMFFVKKGMASKAFKKNLLSGDMKKLGKQMDKGTVQYYPNR